MPFVSRRARKHRKPPKQDPATLFVAAFLYANVASNMDKLLFNLLNLAGALLLLYSLSIHFNLASTLMEIAWAIIAFVGLVQAIRARKART